MVSCWESSLYGHHDAEGDWRRLIVDDAVVLIKRFQSDLVGSKEDCTWKERPRTFVSLIWLGREGRRRQRNRICDITFALGEARTDGTF